jgi:hypothetical protein
LASIVRQPDGRLARRPAPPPLPAIHHGVALAPTGGAVVSARWAVGERTKVIDLKSFDPSLREVGACIRNLLERDPSCRILVDAGLHGGDLQAYLGRLHRVKYFGTSAPLERRLEIAGKLRAAYELSAFSVDRSLADSPLRAALARVTRDDAGDDPFVVALSLAVVNRRRVPRIG